MDAKKVEYDGNSYAKYRPSYSDEIYSLTYQFHDKHNGSYDLSVDVGTGTGQVATELSSKFKQVCGIDNLASQIDSATPRDNIIYNLGPGEDLSFFKEHSVDLITVGTAFHWFDHDIFFKEAKRVLKPETGTLSIFGYFCPLLKNYADLNEPINSVWGNAFKKYTNPKINFMINLYRDITFPFEEQQWYITPKSEDTQNVSPPTQGSLMELTMPLKNYLSFFTTCSAYKNYLNDKDTQDQDPVEYMSQFIKEALQTNDLETQVDVEWPTVLILAKNN